jgi:hypothetical protein
VKNRVDSGRSEVVEKNWISVGLIHGNNKFTLSLGLKKTESNRPAVPMIKSPGYVCYLIEIKILNVFCIEYVVKLCRSDEKNGKVKFCGLSEKQPPFTPQKCNSNTFLKRFALL